MKLQQSSAGGLPSVSRILNIQGFTLHLEFQLKSYAGFEEASTACSPPIEEWPVDEPEQVHTSTVFS